jgi:RNase H-fold protein (predicted Holliday junction resolvase)
MDVFIRLARRATRGTGEGCRWNPACRRHSHQGGTTPDFPGTSSGDEDIASDAFSLAMAPGKRRSSATAEPVASMAEDRKETIGQTTDDLGAEIMSEMEEVERIATSSNNLKVTYVRRLRQESRKVRAIGAELQQRTVVPVGYPVNTDGKSKMEEELARLRSRVRELEDEVSRILVTVGQWFGTAVGKKAEEDEMRTTMGAERGAKRMTPGVLTEIVPPSHHRRSRTRTVPEALEGRVEQKRETEIRALGFRWRIPGISGRHRWLGEAAETEPRLGQAHPLASERRETPLGRRPYHRPTRGTSSQLSEGGDGGGEEHCRRVRPSSLQETGEVRGE